jgi:hypothetical protein
MTYGYGEGAPSPRHGQPRDESDGGWPQPPYGPPPPRQAVEDRARSGTYASGDGGPQAYGASAQPYGGAPGQYGVDVHQPPWRFEDYGVAEATPNRRRRSRKPLGFAIAVVVLLIGGGAGWFYLRDSHTSLSTEQHPKIADQKIDPTPLTAAEVFGARAIPAAKGGGSYKILKTQAATDCKTAAAGDVAAALMAAGCTQVVRATLMSPDNAFVITAGVFNLADATKAGKAAAATKTAVDAQKGRFSGMVAGGATNVIDRAAANVAWKVRGHYLTYCLIAKADGGRIAPSGSPTQVMTKDLVDGYLDGVVIHKRETGSGAPAPSGRPS